MVFVIQDIFYMVVNQWRAMGAAGSKLIQSLPIEGKMCRKRSVQIKRGSDQCNFEQKEGWYTIINRSTSVFSFFFSAVNWPHQNDQWWSQIITMISIIRNCDDNHKQFLARRKLILCIIGSGLLLFFWGKLVSRSSSSIIPFIITSSGVNFCSIRHHPSSHPSS